METVIGLASGLAGGVLLTLVGTYLLSKAQHRRLELGYEVLSSHTIIPRLSKLATPDIRVMVRTELLDPHAAANSPLQAGEEYTVVDDIVSAVRVLLKNTGNQPLEQQLVTIDLAEPAITLSASIERQPDLGPHNVAVEPQFDAPHRTRLTVPFLNPGQELIVSLLRFRVYTDS